MNVQTVIEPATLASAMASAFAEIEGATKSANNPHFKSKYADLGAVIEAIKPALIAHGLFFTQRPQPSEGGVTIATVLHHTNGEAMELGTLFVPANKNDAQAFGSALTYARRYALVTAFGVPTEDDDGNHAAKGQSEKREVSHPATDAQDGYKFPDGPATGITQLKAMAREIYRDVNSCTDDSELNGVLCTEQIKAVLKQLAALENPSHREIWEGDGKDNPGLAGLITRKETEFAQRMVDLGNT